jgi:hypothetical protein
MEDIADMCYERLRGGNNGGPVCVCLLLQDLVQSCLRVWGDIGGHVLRVTTSLCGLVCPSRTSERGGHVITQVARGERDIVENLLVEKRVCVCVFFYCVCLLLQDLVQSCLRGEGDIGGHVL